MFDLKGKAALITGATGGIGGAIAKTLHEAGAKVILSGTRMEVLEQLQNTLGKRAEILQCNLLDSTSVESLFSKAEEAFGPVDILVCNAGITRDQLIMRMKNEDWDSVLAVNLTALFKLNRAAVTQMIKRRYGRIINISSVVGFMGNTGQSNYAAAKAGIIGMSKSIALEVASRGVTVNAIAPGFIATPMTDIINEAMKQKIAESIPMKRIGTPEEVASAVLFLASAEAGYITGATLDINGGMYNR